MGENHQPRDRKKLERAASLTLFFVLILGWALYGAVYGARKWIICKDRDRDGHYADGWKYRKGGGDCNDANPDVWSKCETCRDQDQDGAYVGCEQYVRHKKDCDDQDPNNWLKCESCKDADQDGYFDGCDRYKTVKNDCDDNQANQWSSCYWYRCQDYDQDGFWANCDGYNGIKGPDCNDGVDFIHPGAKEICDDFDNDCNGLVDEGLKPEFVKFPDPNLEMWVLTWSWEGIEPRDYDKKEREPKSFPRTRLCGMREFYSFVEGRDYGSGGPILNLSGIEYLAGLRILELPGQGVKEIKQLSSLVWLEELNLVGNPIMDLSPLSGLTRLKKLSLGGMKATDISPLANLRNLQNLTLWKCDVRDLGPLLGLKHLSQLTISSNQLDPEACEVEIPALIQRGVRINDNPCPSAK